MTVIPEFEYKIIKLRTGEALVGPMRILPGDQDKYVLIMHEPFLVHLSMQSHNNLVLIKYMPFIQDKEIPFYSQDIQGIYKPTMAVINLYERIVDDKKDAEDDSWVN